MNIVSLEDLQDSIFLTGQKTKDLLKSIIFPLAVTVLHDLGEDVHQLPGYSLVPLARAVNQVIGETLGRLKIKLRTERNKFYHLIQLNYLTLSEMN